MYQLLISGGGQLLVKDDGVKIPLESGLPVGNDGYSMHVWFMIYGGKKLVFILDFLIWGKG